MALVAIHKDAEEHIDDVDECLGADQAFPEIPRLTHLGQEVEEQHGPSVGVDSLVKTVERGNKTFTTASHASRRLASIGVDGTRAEGIAKRRLSGHEIGRRVRGNTHPKHKVN